MKDFSFTIASQLPHEVAQQRMHSFSDSKFNKEAANYDRTCMHSLFYFKNEFIGAITLSPAAETIDLWSKGSKKLKSNDVYLSRGFVKKNVFLRQRDFLSLMITKILCYLNETDFITSVKPSKQIVINILKDLGFQEFDRIQSYHTDQEEPVELILMKYNNSERNFNVTQSRIVSSLQQTV